MDGKEASVDVISAAVPVHMVAIRRPYSLQDFELLATLGTGIFGRVHLVQLKDGASFHALKI